jgi:hypothetical protein
MSNGEVDPKPEPCVHLASVKKGQNESSKLMCCPFLEATGKIFELIAEAWPVLLIRPAGP